MGISNLLPFVQKACRKTDIVELKGMSMAIDVSCLLHKGLFGCMEQFAEGKDTKFYIYYVKKHVQALLDLDCHVILVFDGRPLPAKKDTNDERRMRRLEMMRAGEVLMSKGKKEEAVNKFKQAVSITQEVVENTIEFFRKMANVDVIVSPYESDAQLAFLVKNGLADAVITEDSDLIPFGCEKIVFKWNSENGSCTLYEKENLYKCFTGEMYRQFDFDKFRRICILSGCDYLQSGLAGVGLSKAVTFFMKTQQTDMRKVLPRVPRYLNMSKLRVTPQFIDEFIRAENTFLHQVVFDPRDRCQRPLNPYPIEEKKKKEEEEELDELDEDFVKKKSPDETSSFSYAGVVSSTNISLRLALGNSIDSQPMMDKFLLPSKVPEWSIWSDKYETSGKKMRRKTEETLKKAKQCGAFVLDSPSKKVAKSRRPTIDDCEILLGDTPEKQAKRNDENKPSPRIPSKRKLIKNEADRICTFDEMMKTYSAENATEKEQSSGIEEKPCEEDIAISKEISIAFMDEQSSKNEVQGENEVRKEMFLSQQVSYSEEVVIVNDEESGKLPTEEKSDVKQKEESVASDSCEVKAVSQKTSFLKAPSVKRRASFQSPLLSRNETSPAATSSNNSPVTKVIGKSSYFAQRKPNSCSNPFKRPKIEVPVSPHNTEKPPSSDEKTPTRKSILPSLEDDCVESTDSVTSYRFSPLLRSVGFRPPGLRKSKTT